MMTTSSGGALGSAGTRDAALRWAASARSTRQQVRSELATGDTTLAEVLTRATTDPLVGQVKLLWALESLPGARKIDTRRRLAALGIDAAAPLSQLDGDQHVVVLANFEPAVDR
ncbi:MAG: hypothetical protein ACK4V6_08850 [Microthrixaceae bacterium]